MVPQTLHQIWLGRKPFPAEGERWCASFARFMPDWKYRRWGDEDLPALADRLLCPHLVLDESVGMGIRVDVMRYELMRLFGGVYMDHDIEIFRPLDEIIEKDCVHFALSFNSIDDVSTALFASPAGHPFWDLLLRRLRASVPPRRPDNPWDVLQLTGYRAVSCALRAWLNDNLQSREVRADDSWTAGWLFEHGNLLLWSREAVHPYHVGELHYQDFRLENFPRAYAAHHWQGQWFGEDAEARAGIAPGVEGA